MKRSIPRKISSFLPPFLKIIGLCFAFLSFFSCASQINGSLKAGGQAELFVGASLQPRMAALIRNLAAAGNAANGPLLDGAAIARSMAAAPGIESAAFKNTAPAAIEGSVAISKISDFLASGTSGGFISFEQTPSGGRMVITLSRDSGPRVLSLISPEITAYVSALMAPLATGEVMSKTEYLFLVRTVFSQGIADEISQSSIRASIEFPGPVQSVKGGTFSGRRAEFVIPLLDILVLETPLGYEAAWK